LGSESTLVPEGCKSSAKVLAAMSALPGTLTGIDAQPNSAAAKDFGQIVQLSAPAGT
jgi:hypothetical protein